MLRASRTVRVGLAGAFLLLGAIGSPACGHAPAEGERPAAREAPLGQRAEAQTEKAVVEELLDKGDDPTAFGCVGAFLNEAGVCKTRHYAFGDACESEVELAEVTLKECQPTPVDLEPFVKLYDCREVLGDPNARCVEKEGVCRYPKIGEEVEDPSNPSARCEIPAPLTGTYSIDPSNDDPRTAACIREHAEAGCKGDTIVTGAGRCPGGDGTDALELTYLVDEFTAVCGDACCDSKDTWTYSCATVCAAVKEGYTGECAVDTAYCAAGGDKYVDTAHCACGPAADPLP